MSTAEELQEHAEHAHNPFDKRVAASMAIIAAALAVVSVLGHISTTEALRLHVGEIFLEIAIVFASLAILTKRPLLYWTAVGSGLTGIVVACTELFVHA